MAGSQKAVVESNSNLDFHTSESQIKSTDLVNREVSLDLSTFYEHAAIIEFLQFAQTTKDPEKLRERRVCSRLINSSCGMANWFDIVLIGGIYQHSEQICGPSACWYKRISITCHFGSIPANRSSYCWIFCQNSNYKNTSYIDFPIYTI